MEWIHRAGPDRATTTQRRRAWTCACAVGRVCAAGVILSLAVPASVRAQPATPPRTIPVAARTPTKAGPGTAQVRQANEALSALLKAQATADPQARRAIAAKVTAAVRNFLDIDELGRRALVDTWSSLTKAQQDQFLDLLRFLIERNYVSGKRSTLAYEVAYLGETTAPDGTITVTTEITATHQHRPFSITIEYRLAKQGARLRAFDVATDGVGLVENYRAMFMDIINKYGFDGLIHKMTRKAARMPEAS